MGLVLGLSFVVHGLAQDGDRSWLVTGGQLAGTQRVGLPWNGALGQVWGEFSSPSDDHVARNRGEWCLGLSHAGWSASTQTAFHAGAVHEISQGTSLGWVVRARGSRWPDVHARSGSLRFEGEGTQSEPWGSLKLRAFAEVGDRRTLGVASPDSTGRWGGMPWGWEAWWFPEATGAAVPLPGLGWSSGGQWHVMWSSAPAAWSQWRLWNVPRGQVTLSWRFPRGHVEVAWSGSLDQGFRRNDGSTTRTPRLAGGIRQATWRLGTRTGRSNAEWSWSWEWGPHDVNPVP